MRAAVVAFVTDFGRDDTYAAALVGSCLRIDPGLRCISGTHGVPPGDVPAGAYHCAALARDLPQGTVICAVVDPGVGTVRRALAVDAGGVRWVGPDNGLASYLWQDAAPERRRCVALPVPAGASPTFHGRDLFAPAAARLAVGAALEEVGEPTQPPLILDELRVDTDGGELVGRVLLADHFGNLITTVRASDLGVATLRGARWEGGEAARAVRTYAELGLAPGVLVGSGGHVEIAVDGRSAAALTGAPRPGQAVRVLVGAVAPPVSG